MDRTAAFPLGETSLKAIIVGAGIMGLATAWALKRRGHAVKVLDQGPVPNPLGSSFDQHRMTRTFYGDLPEYGPMVEAAFDAYELLQWDLGEDLYHQTGVLGLSASAGDWTDLSRIQMQRDGHDFTTLTPGEVRRRYPVLTGHEVSFGVHTKRGGVLLAERIVAGLARWLGDSLRPETKVAAIDPANASVTLADGTRLEADRLAVTAGPWIGELVPGMARRVTSYRQVAVYVAPPEPLRAAWQAMPAVVDLGGDDELYVFPPVAGTDLKVGFGRYKSPASPDSERQIAGGEPEQVLARFRPYLSSFEDYRVIGARTCCYSMTGDRHFIVEPLSASSWAASPCSGHGFKFGAAIGLRLAAALSGDLAAKDMTDWAAGRAPHVGVPATAGA